VSRRLYVPLDVNYADDPAIVEAGPDAELLYVRSLALAKRLEDDGVIHRGHLRRLAADLPAVAAGVTADTIADRLVATGLWATHADGWRIAAWLDWNASAAEIDARRTADRERKTAWRKAKTDPDPDDPQPTTRRGRPAGHGRRATPDTDRNPSGHERRATRSEVKSSDTEDEVTTERPLVGFAHESTDSSPQVDQVFAHWLTATGRTTRTRLDTRRRNRILWALDHYPIDEILTAITNAAISPWHAGHNPEGRRYDDIALILRDAEHLERFRDQPPIHARPHVHRDRPPLWIIDDQGIAHRSEAS
jgi:hypothetical protein